MLQRYCSGKIKDGSGGKPCECCPSLIFFKDGSARNLFFECNEGDGRGANGRRVEPILGVGGKYGR